MCTYTQLNLASRALGQASQQLQQGCLASTAAAIDEAELVGW